LEKNFYSAFKVDQMLRIFLVVNLFLQIAFAQIPCAWTDTKGVYYDLSPLRNDNTDYFIAKDTFPKQDWDIWMNICRGTVQTLCGAGVVACQQWDPSNPGGKAAMGIATSQQFLVASSTFQQGTYGVSLLYTGGADSRETQIDFKCNPSKGTGAPVFAGENPTHHYLFQWESAIACPPGKGGLSVGSILLIIVLCLLVVYFVAGVLFNKFKRQLTGVEIIPNVTFWTSIPGLVKDGVMFLVNKVRNRGGYTTV